ncbi:hypothetical protein KCP75_04160 [Salmonella enterica subsp. enterica]|nr:hypothetical protein KCP75_04160 [Salmonella enterica subsp. enterica]
MREPWIALLARLKSAIRANCSSPPAHGASIVATITVMMPCALSGNRNDGHAPAYSA